MTNTHSSPLMFGEEYDHIHCILRGEKRIILVNGLKYPDVRQIVAPDDRQYRGLPVDPDRVDFNKFPAFADIDYYGANLTSGDCLFVPSSWIFQERSIGSTISVIYNINHEHALEVNLNDDKTCSSFDSSFTLDQIDWASIENEPPNLKELMMHLINTNSNGFENWQKVFSKHLSFDLASDPEASTVFEEFYSIVDMNGDGEITTSEVELINGVHQHHISDILYEMARIIHAKRKTSGSKVSDKKAEEEEEEGEEEVISTKDEDDEHLHLQQYKTDL